MTPRQMRLGQHGRAVLKFIVEQHALYETGQRAQLPSVGLIARGAGVTHAKATEWTHRLVVAGLIEHTSGSGYVPTDDGKEAAHA